MRLTVSEKKQLLIKRSTFFGECVVDIDGYFHFLGTKYQISEMVEEYKVANKPKFFKGEVVNEYTNTCYMTKIYASVIDSELHFYDEEIKLIDENFITRVDEKYEK